MIDYEVLKRCEEKFLEKALTNDVCGPWHSSEFLFSDLKKYDKNFRLMDAMQSMTRLYFVSEVVSEYVYKLFEKAGMACLKGKTQNIEVNGDYCRKNLFEYIFIKDGLRYAVTFEDEPPYNERLLIENYKISQIYCVSLMFFKKKEYIIPLNRRYTVDISFKEFLTNILGMAEKDYRKLINEFKKIYQKGIEIQGLNVRQDLNDNSMFNFKKRVYENLLEEFHPAKTIGYCFRLGKPNNNYKQLPDNDEYIFSKANLCRDFRTYASCLIGDKPFAVSFITAEYLYDILNSNDSIDYTPVILDYIKSIEQLIREILTFTNIKFDKEKASLKNLASILCKNYNSLFVKDVFLSNNLEKIIKDFADYSRNSFIHRENILDYKFASRIRNNAHFILFAIISAFKAKHKNIKEKVLGCIDFDFLDTANLAKTLRPGLDTVDIFTHEGKSFTATTINSMALTPLKDIKEIPFKDIETGEIITFDQYDRPLSLHNIDKGLSDEILGSESFEEEMGYEEPDAFFIRKLDEEIGKFLKAHPNVDFERVKVLHAHFQLLIDNGYSFIKETKEYKNADVSRVFIDSCKELKTVIRGIAKQYNLHDLHITDKDISDGSSDISPFTKIFSAVGYYQGGNKCEFTGLVSVVISLESERK